SETSRPAQVMQPPNGEAKLPVPARNRQNTARRDAVPVSFSPWFGSDNRSSVTVLRLPALSPNDPSSAARGRPPAPPCRPRPQGGGPGRLQRIVRPGLAPIRLPTPFVVVCLSATHLPRCGRLAPRRSRVPEAPSGSLAFVSRPGDVI